MKWALPLTVVLAVAVLVWLAFYPAIMSADSLDQYRQAVAGEYNDWHPPVMSIFLAGLLRIGAGIGCLTFLQCTLGLAGVWVFALVLQQSFSAAPASRGVWSATLIALVLLLPVTPLAFYLMTFWKDAWLALVLLWIGALSAALHDAPPAARCRWLPAGTAALLALMALAVLTRHNAILLVPVFCVLVNLIFRHQRLALRTCLTLTPLVLVLGEPALNRCFRVRVERPAVQVKALELVGLCVRDPALRDKLPFTNQNLIDDLYRKYYVFGYAGPVCWEQPAIVQPTFIHDEAELTREYWHAVRTYPAALTAVKVRAVLPLLDLDQTPYWFHDQLNDNPYGLHWTPQLQRPRAAFIAIAGQVASSPWRWISGVHFVWLVTALAGSVCMWALYVRTHTPRFRLYGVLLLIPLLYYASFLLATTGHDFRFMYPATLFVQVFLAAGAAFALAHMCRRRSCPPSRSVGGKLTSE